MFPTNNELYHHGIKGMRWGIRRFQKEDGTLTNAGKKRYNDISDGKSDKPKSKHRQNLEAKYRAMGYDEKHAAERAAKRIKTEKIIAATAGLTVAAASDLTDKEIIKMLNEQTSGSD